MASHGSSWYWLDGHFYDGVYANPCAPGNGGLSRAEWNKITANITVEDGIGVLIASSGPVTTNFVTDIHGVTGKVEVRGDVCGLVDNILGRIRTGGVAKGIVSADIDEKKQWQCKGNHHD